MRINRLIFLIIGLFTAPLQAAAQRPDWVIAGNAAIDRIGCMVEQKYDLHLGGTGGEMFDCVHSLFFMFQTDQILNQDQARTLFVNMMSDALADVNNDEDLRPHMEKYPFTTKNIKIMIIIVDKKGRRPTPPAVAAVSNIGDKIYYRFRQNDAQSESYAITETYAEAFRIVAEQPPHTAPSLESGTAPTSEGNNRKFKSEPESEANRQAYTFLPMNYKPYVPPLQLALPDSFIISSYPPEERPLLIEGVIWTTESEIFNIAHSKQSVCRPVNEPTFFVLLCEGPFQIGRHSFSHEANLKQIIARDYDWENITTYKTSWGDYPLLVAQGTRYGQPQCVAWMGLNRQGFVITFRYFFSKHEQNYHRDQLIWDTFISNTSQIK